MPLLSYHSALPLDLWEIPRTFYETMAGIVWYLMAFVASISLFDGTTMGVQSVSAQYLLGLGEYPSFKGGQNQLISYRDWRHHWVSLSAGRVTVPRG